MSKVLVTGGSGFVGSHCILQLLAAGHEVRTTVRDLKREADVRAMLRAGGAEAGDRLSLWRRPDPGCGLGGGSGWMRFCAPRASPFQRAYPSMRIADYSRA